MADSAERARELWMHAGNERSLEQKKIKHMYQLLSCTVTYCSSPFYDHGMAPSGP